MTVLPALESATAGWTNVKDQTYTMGVTTFKTNAYTGNCDFYNGSPVTCEANTYILESRTGKARMITVQEATELGCTSSNQSCPIWMNNYLKGSTSYGGTEEGLDAAYWTMSAGSDQTNRAFYVYHYGNLGSEITTNTYYGARAVVVINKQ